MISAPTCNIHLTVSERNALAQFSARRSLSGVMHHPIEAGIARPCPIAVPPASWQSLEGHIVKKSKKTSGYGYDDNLIAEATEFTARLKGKNEPEAEVSESPQQAARCMKLRRRVTAAALNQKGCQLGRVSDVALNNDYFPSRVRLVLCPCTR